MKICDLPYEFALSVIMSDQLHIDYNYHQNPSSERIERMRERIEEDNLSVQPFVVSLRDNKYYIIQDVDVKLALDMINGEKLIQCFAMSAIQNHMQKKSGFPLKFITIDMMLQNVK